FQIMAATESLAISYVVNMITKGGLPHGY
ncbi:MAG: hypothetical protein ACI81F_000209, partial [Thalassolituus oleivorans]